MIDRPAYAAIDLGASSGRVLRGTLAGGRVELEPVHRFANEPVRTHDGLHWNLLGLFAESLGGLRGCGAVRSAGVAAWGVDYALLDAANHLLGVPFHYRDQRTDGMIERAQALVSRDQAYAVAGIQTMPINTVFQLLAEDGGAGLAAAEHIALVPDLFGLWLTGRLVNERTAASTTGLLDAATGEWSHELIEGYDLPTRPFGALVEPGTNIGPPLAGHATDVTAVRAVAGHDTASAYVAAPLAGEHDAVLSSGTWSLLGVELNSPVLGAGALEYDLTNERGVDGTTRLLKNVMGLWLEQECARVWEADHAELFAAAADAGGDVALFDPDDDSLLAPGDMPARIAEACRDAGQEPPVGRGTVVRSILTSLACKYRLVLERLEVVTGRSLRRIHVVGGGVQVELLCELTAQITGREVLAGAMEATALGNILVQARADGALGSLAEMREVASASARPRRYEPGGEAGDQTYHRFLQTTGFAQPVPA